MPEHSTKNWIIANTNGANSVIAAEIIQENITTRFAILFTSGVLLSLIFMINPAIKGIVNVNISNGESIDSFVVRV